MITVTLVECLTSKFWLKIPHWIFLWVGETEPIEIFSSWSVNFCGGKKGTEEGILVGDRMGTHEFWKLFCMYANIYTHIHRCINTYLTNKRDTSPYLGRAKTRKMSLLLVGQKMFFPIHRRGNCLRSRPSPSVENCLNYSTSHWGKNIR